MLKKIMVLSSILLLTLTTGCLYLARYDANTSGKIIDADTGKPLEGVVVLGEWHTGMMTVAGEVSSYYDSRETVTDENGEYTLPGKGPRVMSNLNPVYIRILKAGYEYIGMWPPEKGKEKKRYWKDRLKWEGSKPIILLKKLTMEERKKQGTPPSPASEAPFEKVKLYLKERNKVRVEQGLKPLRLWGGMEYE